MRWRVRYRAAVWGQVLSTEQSIEQSRVPRSRTQRTKSHVQEENLTACATENSVFSFSPCILKSAANYKTHEAVLKEWQRLDPLLSSICRDFGLDFKLYRLARELERLTNTESQTSCITQCWDLSFSSLIIQQPHLSRKKIIMKAFSG